MRETAIALTADQLGRADFDADADGEPRTACWPACRPARSRCPSASCPTATTPPGLLQRLGARTVVAATVRAIQLLGRQFVLGRDDRRGDGARPRRQRQASSRSCASSYDMLGEGARTERDARALPGGYRDAIDAHRRRRASAAAPEAADGISIKLQRPVLALRGRAARARLRRAAAARAGRWSSGPPRADINLTIDAEESDRLELSLDVFEALAARIAQRASRLARLRPGGAGLPDARAGGDRRSGAHRARATACASWCGWSRAPTGTARSSARRSWACRLPGVHAQAPHRHRLPGLRAAR